MSTVIGPDRISPRDILNPLRQTGRSDKKSSSHQAHEFTVTGNQGSIHMRGHRDPLFEVNELMNDKREEQNQSEFWIG